MSDSKGDSHCVCINDFNRLNYCQSKHRGEKFFCSFCLQCFTTQEILDNINFLVFRLTGNKPLTYHHQIVLLNLRFKKLIAPFVIFAYLASIIMLCEEQHKDKTMGYTC